MWKRDTILIKEKFIRDFQSKITDLSNKGYFVIGTLCINKTIESIIPFRLQDEFMLLMQKTWKDDEDESN